MAASARLDYTIDPRLDRAVPIPYERKSDDPLSRPLRIFTVDPTLPRLQGAVAVVEVGYEPLEPGPTGRLISIESLDSAQGIRYRRANLEDRAVLMGKGYDPEEGDPRFHQQMTYAVCSKVCTTFTAALGRNIHWGENVGATLRVFPHSCYEANAFYDEAQGALHFGYYQAHKISAGSTLPGGMVFTCLSHDVVAHEVTHALLDGLRAHFTLPTGPDVLAFHEAFADIVAIFQRFSYGDVVRNAIAAARGDLSIADELTDLARQLGSTTRKRAALRKAIDTNAQGRPTQMYDATLEPHALGAVLLAAVFEAFITVYRRKSARFIRLATGGSGVIPQGELSADLCALLVDQATKLASQFLSICIRAIDYCPPVGVNFGDYLRALITADHDLEANDPYDYRGALIEAFRRRRIYPRGVTNLSEGALLWRPTRKTLPAIEPLRFERMRFSQPGQPVPRDELRRRAHALGEFVSRPEHREEFGLVVEGDPRLDGDSVTAPCVHSIRTVRRVGANGHILFDLVAEVTQLRQVRGAPESYHGGSTIIAGPDGVVRLAVLKNVCGADRLERRLAYLRGEGRRFWQRSGRLLVPKTRLFKMVHG